MTVQHSGANKVSVDDSTTLWCYKVSVDDSTLVLISQC